MQILGRDLLISLGIMILCIGICYRKPEKNLVWKYVGILVLTLMMGIIFSLTGVTPLSGFHTEIHLREIAWIPFQGMIEMLQGGISMYAIINLGGNLLMFFPVGFLFPLLWERFRSMKKTVCTGFLISLMIECSQLFLARGTDVDDLILNTLGTLLGYGCYRLFVRIMPRFSQKFQLLKHNLANYILPVLCVAIPYITVVLLGFYDRAKIFLP
ncbi:MAG: VanZ family protein [Lachnospiraceae bacterium]|nr:VanZ family protein [Lachnospiraceae bacterium]MDD3615723.1 VanZ family protein [Lachnospiraceae bacterium]